MAGQKRIQVIETDGSPDGAPGARREVDFSRLPPMLEAHYRANGMNVCLIRASEAALASLGMLGFTPILVEDLPEREREAMVKDCRRHSYQVREDGTIRFGDGLLSWQSETDRIDQAEWAERRWQQMSVSPEEQAHALRENFGAAVPQAAGTLNVRPRAGTGPIASHISHYEE